LVTSLTQTVFEILASKYWVCTDGRTEGRKDGIKASQYIPHSLRSLGGYN